jgi:hypothetical protein
LQKLPPALRLGLRVLGVQQRARVIPAVVVVTDAGSYLDAVGSWTPGARFPVLIDDGSAASRERIAMFVRGFEGARVVRWATTPERREAEFTNVPRARLVDAMTRARGFAAGTTPEELAAAWKAGGYEPPGVVVMHEQDAAWPAGVALAAGRCEWAAFIGARQGVDTLASPAEADDLERQVEAAAEASGFAWRGLGDALDAVSLCLHTPNRLDKGQGEFLAVTDRIGRSGDGVEMTTRWAYTGQVFGGPSRAAYAAMCSLFIQPRTAWLFDGYPDTPPWSVYDCGKAGEVLTQAGLAVEVMDTPRQSARDWRVRAARPIEGGVVLVNTKGNDDFFDLEKGQCRPGDVPWMLRPAAAHVVHSWSATNIGNRERLGGRWLERGVFAYAGSVHEPYLSAFVPTPAVAGRLASGGAFGACVRHDEAKVWKIAVIGDPLYTLGRPAAREDGPLPLEGAVEVTANLRDLLTSGKYEEALGAMVLAGREADAVKLVTGLMEREPGAITPGAAGVAVPLLTRAGRNDLVWRAFARLDAAGRRDPSLRDALWLTSLPLLEGNPDPAMMDLLQEHVRADMPVRDAMTLGAAWRRMRGHGEAVAMLREVRTHLPTEALRTQLDGAMNSPPEAWGN